MNLIFSTDTLIRGGKERQLCLLASKLPEDRFNSLIITKKRNFSKNNNYLNEYGISDKSVLLFDNFREYRDLIKKHKPDLVFSWDTETALYNLILFRKYSFSLINGSIQHGIRLLKISHFFRSVILWLSPYVVANSIAGLRANNLKLNKNNFVLHNGVDMEIKKVLNTDDKYELRRQLLPFTDNKNTFIISVANFVPYKDYFTVLNALYELRDKIKYEYIIIGDGPLKQEIENTIVKLNLKNSVHILGRVVDVNKYLKISDIFIHSSRGEGISNAILEAMMNGLPVVSSDVGGVRETVYEKYSFLYRYKDKEGLKKCVIKAKDLINTDLFNDENYVKHLKKFSTETMMKNFLNIINNIINRKN